MSVTIMVATWAMKLTRKPTVMILRTICQRMSAPICDWGGEQVRCGRKPMSVCAKGTYRAVLPEYDNTLEDEEVRDSDRDDGEHRTGEDEVLASVARSATANASDLRSTCPCGGKIVLASDNHDAYVCKGETYCVCERSIHESTGFCTHICGHFTGLEGSD